MIRYSFDDEAKIINKLKDLTKDGKIKWNLSEYGMTNAISYYTKLKSSTGQWYILYVERYIERFPQYSSSVHDMVAEISCISLSIRRIEFDDFGDQNNIKIGESIKSTDEVPGLDVSSPNSPNSLLRNLYGFVELSAQQKRDNNEINAFMDILNSIE